MSHYAQQVAERPATHTRTAHAAVVVRPRRHLAAVPPDTLTDNERTRFLRVADAVQAEANALDGAPWSHRGACRHEDPEEWFRNTPPGRVPAGQQRGGPNLALSICTQLCPVRAECLRDTEATERRQGGGLWGVFGGRTAEQRTAERAARAADARKAAER